MIFLSPSSRNFLFPSSRYYLNTIASFHPSASPALFFHAREPRTRGSIDLVAGTLTVPFAPVQMDRKTLANACSADREESTEEILRVVGARIDRNSEGLAGAVLV